jgi:hypothetical protein
VERFHQVDATPTLPRGVAPQPSGHPADQTGAPAPAAGLVLGRYRLLNRLGAGGFGTVWVARDERLGREVALKSVPRARVERRPGAGVERAQREALAAARLNHPAVVTLYEAGSDEHSHHLISELVRGRTLDELVAARALSDREVAVIGLALAGALGHAHDRGVVHRDVKPQNVIVPDRPQGPAGVAKLTDFGIARLAGDEPLTRTGDVVGTLAYMAPEQAEGRRVGPEADLYALALVLYEALAGSHPVRGPGPAATARRLGAVLPSLGRARRDLPAPLVAAIDRALAPNPRDRGSLAELRAALEDAMPALSVEGGTLALPLTRPRLPRGTARVAAALAAGGLAGAASLLAGPPPAGPLAIFAAVALAVGLLPRLGWAAAALGTLGWLALGPGAKPGLALAIGAGLVAVPVLLPRCGRAWSVPAGAPLLGLASLAVTFPALAGQAATWRRRGGLAIAGAWWLALAQALAARDLHLGRPPGTYAPGRWEDSLTAAAGHAVLPALNAGTGALALAWAAAAIVLPWLVRGRSLAVDLLGAGLWAAGLWTASLAAAGLVAGGAGGAGAAQGPEAVAGTVAAGALALSLRWLGGGDRRLAELSASRH